MSSPTQTHPDQIQITYNDGVVRQFLLASVLFGVVALLAGVWIATELAWHQANLNTSWLSFGRLRPLHTNAAIFAFVGNMIFAGIYYSLQRLLKARLYSDFLSRVHFWGWQLIIVLAAVTLPLGITQGKEYAELEWPIDLLITVVWVIFAINFFMTIARRREKHLYVAVWFYIATVVTVAILHLVNNLALPLSMWKSYSVFAGVQDALVQWWYGHNAVAFFLTTPVLGIMYYFLPKAADRPIFSYRLSIVHFWALVFVYIWAGPHHLLNTALPEWAQSLGMVFSLALWAPSWGGMLNGLLTLRGAWDRVRRDPVLKFYVAGVTFYGMATFEGPLLSIKSVSALGHYTDWIIGHVHGGTLGWNGFMAAGMFYWLVPKLWGAKLHSRWSADAHFWIGLLGILLYMASMWVSGITQGLMWRAEAVDGGLLYPNFVDTLLSVRSMYMARLAGGLLYFVGFLLMVWNLGMTIKAGRAVDGKQLVQVSPEWRKEQSERSSSVLFSPAILLVVMGVIFLLGFLVNSWIIALSSLVGLCGIGGVAWSLQRRGTTRGFHRLLEGRPLMFTVWTVIAVLVGGMVELVPTLTLTQEVPVGQRRQKPYTPLQLAGRDIYVREGCYTCHSQMIRPFRDEVLRYGEPSEIGEFIFDHPFQWGSKRTGPDLHREGGKRDHLWHHRHLVDPRATSPGSNMPSYAFLEQGTADPVLAASRLALMKKLGVPYSRSELLAAQDVQASEGESLLAELRKLDPKTELKPNSEMVALIAYLQSLGNSEVVP